MEFSTPKGRRPPYSEDAEQAVLSAMLMDEKAIAEVLTILGADSFYREAHCRIYTAMQVLFASGSAVDPLTLSEKLESSGTLSSSGGKDYVSHLVDAVPTSANVSYHARIVQQHAERRRVIEIGYTMADRAFNLEAPSEIAQEATAGLLPVAAHTKSRGFVPIADYVLPVLEELERRRANDTGLVGMGWGYHEIDSKMAGQRPGELAFLAGVPACGKTMLLLNICRRAAESGTNVAFISAEMGAKQLVERLLSASTSVRAEDLRRASYTATEWDVILRVSRNNLAPLPFTIDDTAQPKIGDIRAKCRAEKAKNPKLGLIGLDFIQLVTADDDDSRALELTTISYALKGLAKELEVAIIALCQVDAAAVEKTSDKRPHLAQIRWSQAMREAGDMVGMVYRPGLYDGYAPQTIEINFEKMRDMESFKAELYWAGKIMSVDSMPPTPARAA